MTVQPWGKPLEDKSVIAGAASSQLPVKYTEWHFPKTEHRGFLLLDEDGAPIPQRKPRVFRPYRVRIAPRERERFMDSGEWMLFGVAIFCCILFGVTAFKWWFG